jgi:hypothetical protein
VTQQSTQAAAVWLSSAMFHSNTADNPIREPPQRKRPASAAPHYPAGTVPALIRAGHRGGGAERPGSFWGYGS